MEQIHILSYPRFTKRILEAERQDVHPSVTVGKNQQSRPEHAVDVARVVVLLEAHCPLLP